MLAVSTFHLAVPSSANYDYYALFYVLAFTLNLLLLVWEGHRRGYPLRTWLVLLACTTLSFILGTKLLALSGSEWQRLLGTGHWPHAGARTVLGGALASTLTLLALRRPFGFSWHVFDVFTLPLCLGLVVQCVGCVLTGCCFGEPTAAGWGLTYPPGTPPYLVQVAQGQIPAGAAHSLPTQPTQLYALVLCAGVSILLLLTRHRAWPAGSRHFLQVGLLLAGRFGLEFWRDPAGEPVGADPHTAAGLTMMQLQWVLLPAAALMLGGWLWLLYRGPCVLRQPEQLPTPHSGRNLLAVAALLVFTACLGPYALALPEVLVIKALLLTVLGLEGGALLLAASDSVLPARVALPLAGLVLVLTSQAPVDTIRTERESYTNLGVGLSTGSFDRTQNTEGGCGGSTPLLPYQHRYTTGTLDLSRTKLSGTDAGGHVHKAETTFGIRLHAGGDQQRLQLPDSLGPGIKKSTVLLALNPYLRLDRQWFGLGLGLMMGNLGYHKLYYGNQINILDAQVSLRMGPRKVLFAIADYNYLGYGSGNPQQRLGLGSGFGGTRWLLMGGAASSKAYTVAEHASYWSTFVEAQGQLTPQWQASTFLTLGNPQQQQVGFRLSRRLNGKK